MAPEPGHQVGPLLDLEQVAKETPVAHRRLTVVRVVAAVVPVVLVVQRVELLVDLPEMAYPAVSLELQRSMPAVVLDSELALKVWRAPLVELHRRPTRRMELVLAEAEAASMARPIHQASVATEL